MSDSRLYYGSRRSQKTIIKSVSFVRVGNGLRPLLVDQANSIRATFKPAGPPIVPCSKVNAQ